MNDESRQSVVVDVGNSSIDLGKFEGELDQTAHSSDRFPRPLDRLKLLTDSLDLSALHDWLPASRSAWQIGSVNQHALTPLLEWIQQHCANDVVQHVDYRGIGLRIDVDEPAAVGIDRLAAGFAANALRDANRAAIVVDSGTAIKVDVVSPDGAFLGGTISPGLRLGLRSLAQGTNKLPNIDRIETTPPLIGKNTLAAICSGVYWMTVGGITHTIQSMRAQIGEEFGAECDLFATGGAAEPLLSQLDHGIADIIQHEPGLVLSGLAMAKL